MMTALIIYWMAHVGVFSTVAGPAGVNIMVGGGVAAEMSVHSAVMELFRSEIGGLLLVGVGVLLSFVFFLVSTKDCTKNDWEDLDSY